MPVLSEAQVKQLYFQGIGGFPPAKILKELKEYSGEEKICVACTQIDNSTVINRNNPFASYSNRDIKNILNEWIDFLRTNTKALTALHFNTRVPQALFDAACCQENLVELRFKWGAYPDLSALENLRKLQFLYLGPGAGVQDITTLGKLKSLAVLEMIGFKKIEDYSPLISLGNLEQLVIVGPILGYTPVRDLEFLREMPNLRSLALGSISLRKKYTREEFAALRAALPSLYDIGDFLKKRAMNGGPRDSFIEPPEAQ